MGRVAGVLFVKIDGTQYNAKGSFTSNDGSPKREMIVGADQPHGHKELPQVAFIDGMFTDTSDLDIKGLKAIVNGTVTLQYANGKTFVLRNAVYAADGDLTSEEAELQVRFEGLSGEYIPAS